MIKELLQKKYLIYGSSIIFGRGLEYLVLFFAAYYLTKEDYGELEFYKKVIEVGASIFAFGFPTLILSYTRSRDSKNYFYLLSILFVFFIGLLSMGFLYMADLLFLLVPFLFYAVFFTGGITHSYNLVQNGSNHASLYKMAASILFYGTVFISIYYYNVSSMAFVNVSYILMPVGLTYTIIQLYKQRIVRQKALKYVKLFKKLLLGSLTLVVSNFTNMMFLYTDIFVIKLLSSNANVDIANYSFSLNIAGMLLLIPMTLVQVDIEKLKKIKGYVVQLNKKIVTLTVVGILFLIGLFKVLTHFYLSEYKEIFYLFLIILLAKAIQTFSPLYGTMLVIKKKFTINLILNLISLLFNVILSYLFYNFYGLYGIAVAGVVSLLVRYYLLFHFYKKYRG